METPPTTDQLGRTALQVSELCLGTMNFGPTTPQPEAFQILDRALDCDIDFIATANQYGGSAGVGTTETIIGNWLAQGGGRLGGVLSGPATGRRATSEMRQRIESIQPRLEQWETLCGELGERPGDVGVAWLLHQPAVTAGIDAIFPGPGAGPEADAW
jgi:aryl-alcohol dehydrogenase-like predicted oxidoreductase